MSEANKFIDIKESNSQILQPKPSQRSSQKSLVEFRTGDDLKGILKNSKEKDQSTLNSLQNKQHHKEIKQGDFLKKTNKNSNSDLIGVMSGKD